MTSAHSERFWDERARENALYYVDNRIEYTDPDDPRFWDGGDEVLDEIAGLLELELGPAETVVDIGCGVGRMTRALAARVGRVIGVDVSSEMLTRARAMNGHLDNVEWVHGDGAGLAPIPDASVDGCFSHVVFQHLPDPAMTLAYVAEMGRVLKPGGWAGFHVSTDPAVHVPRTGLRRTVRRVVRREESWDADRAWLGSAVAPADLRAAAEHAGLAIERIEREGTQFTFVRARRVTP